MTTPAPESAPPARPSPAWWIYFGLLSLFALGGVVFVHLRVSLSAALELRTFSIRRSGTSQISATVTYRPPAIQGLTNASGMAAT
jgi:hypothetical protein